MCACVSVCVLTRVTQIVTAAHRDLWPNLARTDYTDEPPSHTKKLVSLAYFMRKNPKNKVGVNSYFQTSSAS